MLDGPLTLCLNLPLVDIIQPQSNKCVKIKAAGDSKVNDRQPCHTTTWQKLKWVMSPWNDKYLCKLTKCNINYCISFWLHSTVLIELEPSFFQTLWTRPLSCWSQETETQGWFISKHFKQVNNFLSLWKQTPFLAYHLKALKTTVSCCVKSSVSSDECTVTPVGGTVGDTLYQKCFFFFSTANF